MVENDYGSNYLLGCGNNKKYSPFSPEIDVRTGGFRPNKDIPFFKETNPIVFEPFAKHKDIPQIPYVDMPTQFGQNNPYIERMREIDEDILARAYEKYPVIRTDLMCYMRKNLTTDLNAEKRSKYIQELTEKYIRMCPEYGEYKYEQLRKEQEIYRYMQEYKPFISKLFEKESKWGGPIYC